MSELNWQVETLRGTFFPAVSLRPSPKTWWETATGKSTDTLTVTEGPAGHASARAELPEEGALMQLVCQPGKIDWLYIFPSAIGPDGRLEIAKGGDIDVVFELFKRRLNGWLLTAPPMNRVAFACVLRHPVESKPDGYRFLQKYLPAISIDPENSSDFLYQINRPRSTSKANPPLVINRLSKWSVGTINFRIAADGDPSNIVTGTSGIHCRLELDINSTVENSRVLDAESSIGLMEELVEMAKEIVMKGDRP